MTTRSIASRRRFVQLASTAFVGTILLGPGTGVRPARADDVIQSQDTNIGGIVAEITQVKRKEGVLTIKMRLRNSGNDKVYTVVVDSGGGYDKYYLTAGDKKYFILRDTEKKPLAAGDGDTVNPTIEKGATYTWWAKFAAPPADVKSITVYTPISAPFEDLPITD